ncbi:MAG: squalene/phytoene synthase family protein, partial [Candidatus Puniceispirillaceae bacterium]
MADRGMIRNETLTPQDSLAANGRSFHWASRFLGARMGRNAARLYAFCRLLDDMADDDIPDGPARLACIEADLAAGGTADDPAFAAFRPFMIEMDFSPAVLTALI